MLTPGQIEQFVEHGLCTLRRAFSPQHAAAACDLVWERLTSRAGIDRHDPETWPPVHVLEERIDAPAVEVCFSDALAGAIGQLLGQGRWKGLRDWGFWPVNFSFGANDEGIFPDQGWHVDGNWFTHTLNAPQQGLLVIGLFTDIAPGGGGTVFALGSHQATARVLARFPNGLAHAEVFREVLREPIGNFYEVTGQAGDVVLAHPFLFHNRGFKHNGPPRIINNTEAGLRAPMNFDRPDGDDSVLEESIRRALRSARVASPDAKLCSF